MLHGQCAVGTDGGTAATHRVTRGVQLWSPLPAGHAHWLSSSWRAGSGPSLFRLDTGEPAATRAWPSVCCPHKKRVSCRPGQVGRVSPTGSTESHPAHNPGSPTASTHQLLKGQEDAPVGSGGSQPPRSPGVQAPRLQNGPAVRPGCSSRAACGARLRWPREPHTPAVLFHDLSDWLFHPFCILTTEIHQ